MALVDDLRVLTLALWLGAAAFFSFVVAPTLFSVLRGFHLSNANEIAGTVVTKTLSVVNLSGFVLSLGLLLITLAFAKPRGRESYLLQTGLFTVMALATGTGHWLIAAKMRALRAAMALPIDQVTPDDPRRLEFDNLHHYSVLALGCAMLAAMISVLMIKARPAR